MMRQLWLLAAGIGLFSGCVSNFDGQRMEMASADVENAAEFRAGGVARQYEAMPAAVPEAVKFAAKATNRALADDAAIDNIMAPEGRKMIFTATYFITVPDIRTAQSEAKAMVEKLGGYVQSIDDSGMLVRIPLARADEALAAVAELGEVTSRNISGRDVTEEMTDVQIRLDNLKILLARLQKLAERAGKVEDLLQVEREMARVTTEIEQLEGRLKLLNNQVDFVTLNIRFSAEATPVFRAGSVPIQWVAELGMEIMDNPPVNDRSCRSFDVELPDGFAIVSYDGDTYAINADEAVIKLSRRDDLKNSSDAFWTSLIERALTQRGFKVSKPREITTQEGLKAYVIDGGKTFVNRTFGYQIIMVRFAKEIYLYEVWGPKAEIDGLHEKLNASAESMDLSIWF